MSVEIWGGIEATIVRVGDRWRDQVTETGHRGRICDLDAIAGLGIRTLRYPILWESVAPDHPEKRNWQWHDERLARLRQLGVRPIAGLVHHGSGPHYTNLLDPSFGEKLAVHARAVAERYPWIEMFTPVNEPLTTARFSALYGHWYPHRRDHRSFLQALLNQCRAVVLAMRAVREVIPSARLVQTEDLGKVFSTPLLQYQADYENHRRWLSFDLLTGRIDRHHPLFGYLVENGVTERDLAFFLENDRPPDLLGMNHYLTSERFLDEDVERYPSWFRGGNGRHAYADVEAVRMDMPEGMTGAGARLQELWERYRLPVAVTEVHHGCTREEQLRWLVEVHRAAVELKAAGADVRAVTPWALLGVVDWRSLLLREEGFYEAGAFDVRSTPPRRTALGHAIAALAQGKPMDHPVLDSQGWWHRAERGYAAVTSRFLGRSPDRPRRLLIAGDEGLFAANLAEICRQRGLEQIVVARDADGLAQALDQAEPWAMIDLAGHGSHVGHSAGMSDEQEFTHLLAATAAGRRIPFLMFSSEQVFDGRLGRAYVETDQVGLDLANGWGWADAERAALDGHPSALIVRASSPLCRRSRHHPIHRAFASIEQDQHYHGQPGDPAAFSYLPDLIHMALDLLVDGEDGYWHLVNEGTVSWHVVAERLAEEAGRRFRPVLYDPQAVRPPVQLASARGRLLPSNENALRRFLHDACFNWQRTAVPEAAE
ncbi:MAG TPA: family 1 glycosylhydrolase [Geminicoccus sp.]|uniref:family 1 glycosylhydrolase n=1 Tax=Geminicoccus sp. TaxID=2024832 RepID=UPI002E2FC6E7|nr:family 1 glycosylhydrolase [Geminicoccus sp.]HEX2528035.1 family 1 glycosylhydrolase [Geminicoccus sp.]